MADVSAHVELWLHLSTFLMVNTFDRVDSPLAAPCWPQHLLRKENDMTGSDAAPGFISAAEGHDHEVMADPDVSNVHIGPR